MKLNIWVAIATAPFFFAAPVVSFAKDVNSNEATAQDEKLICRSEREIGSLVKKKRICLTRAEWTERNDRGNRAADRLLEDMRPKATNGQ